MVHPTNQLPASRGKGVERAVRQDDGAIDAARLVGVLGEYADGQVESRIRRRRAISAAASNGCAAAGCGVTQCFEDWCARTR